MLGSAKNLVVLPRDQMFLINKIPTPQLVKIIGFSKTNKKIFFLNQLVVWK